jgi:putative hydrolase of the HAD superfamily
LLTHKIVVHPWPAILITVPARGPTYDRGVAQLNAVVIDWGGVLTPPMADTVRRWIAADQIDWERYVAVVGPWLREAYAADGSGTVNPVHALERGECTVAEFERMLAGLLVTTHGGPVVADGLLTRMLSAGTPLPAMYQLIRDLRAKGVRTALLSNSWGPGGYPREDFPDLFDAVVISGEVGMRKPEPRIFRHAAALLGLEPERCVFVDDVEANVTAAVGCGMTGVHHTEPALTQLRLTELFANR